mgnify:CR=1 FL=1
MDGDLVAVDRAEEPEVHVVRGRLVLAVPEEADDVGVAVLGDVGAAICANFMVRTAPMEKFGAMSRPVSVKTMRLMAMNAGMANWGRPSSSIRPRAAK